MGVSRVTFAVDSTTELLIHSTDIPSTIVSDPDLYFFFFLALDFYSLSVHLVGLYFSIRRTTFLRHYYSRRSDS